MKKLLLSLTLCLALATLARAINITNYLQIITADNGQLILVSDIGTHTNYNITVSNFVRQVALMVATNNNNFSGSNYFSGEVVVYNGNATSYINALALTNSLNWLSASGGTPVNTTTPALWQAVTNNGVTGFIAIYH